MALVDLLTQVNAQLVAANYLPPGAELELGPAARKTRGAPPRVRWMPARDRFEGANPAIRSRDGAANAVRALYTRWVGVDAHIWGGVAAAGDDFSATEALINAVIGAIRAVPIFGIVQLRGGGWVGQEKSDLMALGHLYVLQLEVAVPITDLCGAPTTQTVTGLDLTGEVDFPDATFSADPPP